VRWGHSSAPDTSDLKAVFKREDGFVRVWQLDEDGNTTANGYKDASSHEAHGTGVGMVPGSRINGRCSDSFRSIGTFRAKSAAPMQSRIGLDPRAGNGKLGRSPARSTTP
jgi:hypothetical protein